MEKKYSQYRILRRDGACFYRAFMFRLYEEFIQKGTGHPDLKKAADKIKDGEKFMIENGFDKIVIEEFCELAVNTMNRCIEKVYDETNL